jgi:glutathione synthase
MKWRILCLTDHLTHNQHNSIYGLLSGLVQDIRVSEVWLGSRAVSGNSNFFDGNGSSLLTARVLPGIIYTLEHDHIFSQLEIHDVNEFDAVLLRVPRPVEDSFFYFLEKTFNQPNRIINRPSGILQVSSKEFLLSVPEWCPPMRLISKIEDIREMLGVHEAIVIKPLKEYGGKGVVRILNGVVSDGTRQVGLDEWCKKILKRKALPMLGMKYLKRVHEGDKRIIVANGEVIGASLRLPAAGSWLCNVAQGGTARQVGIDQHERKMTKAISKILLPMGVVLFGMDTLVDDDGKRVLSEINALSPGGIWPAELQTGKPLTQKTASNLIDYLEKTKG